MNLALNYGQRKTNNITVYVSYVLNTKNHEVNSCRLLNNLHVGSL